MTQSSSRSVPAASPLVVQESLTYLTRAEAALREARWAPSPGLRFSAAYVGALQVATSALKSTEALVGRRRERNAWVLLASSIPELGRWSAYFSGLARSRGAAEAESPTLTWRDADDLVDAVEAFMAQTRSFLGLSRPGEVPGLWGSSGESFGRRNAAKPDGRRTVAL